MKINNTCSFLNEKGIAMVEKQYGARYVFETCLRKGNSEWANFPVAVFYNDVAHPKGSNYFALYRDPLTDKFMVTDAGPSVIDEEFAGLEAEGEVVYSRYRHDYRVSKNGAFVDGGRDYFRYGGDPFDDYNLVKFKVVADRLEIIDNNASTQS